MRFPSAVLPRDPHVRMRRAAYLALAFLYGIMLTGALVRLTDSGLGCPNWPSCHGAVPVPALSYHPMIEFSNRVWSMPTTVFSVLAAVCAFRLPERRSDLRISSVAVLVGVLAQIVLGGITVRMHLHPLLVASHFGLSVLILAAATYTAFAAKRGPVRLADRSACVLGFVTLASCACAVVTGILTTASGPHSGAMPNSPVARWGYFPHAVALHAHTVFAYSVLIVALTLWRRRSAAGARDFALLVALVCVQIGLGEWQYRTGLPWGVVLGHVAGASAIWILSCWISLDACTDRQDLLVPAATSTTHARASNSRNRKLLV